MLKFTFTTATSSLDVALLEDLLDRSIKRNPESDTVKHYENCIKEASTITEDERFKDLESTLNAINPLLERAGKLANELKVNFVVEDENSETVISFDHVTGFESPEWRSSSMNC